MPIGFQSITDDGILQIDSERKCYVFKASGVVTSTLGGGVYVATVTRPLGTSPLFFIHEGDGAFLSADISGSNKNYYIYTPAASNVRWYEFDVISGSGVGNVGFQLFNSASQLTFDAAQRPLTPYAVATGVKPSAGVTTSINTGRTYAVHIPTAPLRYIFVTNVPKVGDTGRYYIIRPIRSGSNILFEQYDYIGEDAPGASTNTEMNPVSCIVIDVHNFIAS